MRQLDLHDDTIFGTSDARNPAEQRGLKNYFLEPPGYGAVLQARQTIVVGRKGTGKTAIRTKLLELREEIIHADIEPLLPNHKLFSMYSEMVEGTPEPSYATYEYAWRAYVLAWVLRKLVEEKRLGFQDRGIVKRYLSSMLGDKTQNTILDRISEISLGISDLLNASVKLEAAVVRRGLPTEQEIPILTDAIARACAQHRTYINAYIDRIDQQLEEPLRGELFYRYAKYIGGACLASARIAGQSGMQGDAKSRLRLYVFAREDLLDEVRPHLHSVTEFDGMVFRLKWRMEGLMDLVGARLGRATGEEYDPAWSFELKKDAFFSPHLFYRVFDSFRPDGWSVWHYLLAHTHMRPRDVINFCNKCRTEAANTGKRTISDSALNLGTHEYSQLRYEELVSSGRWMITSYQQLIDSFRRKPLVYTQRTLTDHLRERMALLRVVDVREPVSPDSPPDVEGMIRTLYRAGFLVAPRESDPSLPFIAHYIEPHLAVLDQQKWVIHPAYFRELRQGMEPDNVRKTLEAAAQP